MTVLSKKVSKLVRMANAYADCWGDDELTISGVRAVNGKPEVHLYRLDQLRAAFPDLEIARTARREGNELWPWMYSVTFQGVRFFSIEKE